MKGLAVVLLVALLVLAALPLGLAMADMDCPACPAGGALSIGAMCLAILGLLILVVPQGASWLPRTGSRFRPRLLALTLEKPPRLI